MEKSHTRRNFISVVGGGIVLAAGGATVLSLMDGVPKAALEAWDGPASGGDLRRWILSYAILAPSPHNLQSWLVEFQGEDGIRLFVDPTRLIPETDPYGRQILVGHGAFLEVLHMAAQERGYAAEVRMFPDGEPLEHLDKKPVAEIRLVPSPKGARDPLFAFVTQRRTARESFDEKRPVFDAELEVLLKTCVPSTVSLRGTLEPARVAALSALAIEGYDVEADTPRTLRETIGHVHLGASEIGRYREGIAIGGPKVWWARRLGMFSKEALLDPKSSSFAANKTMFREGVESAGGYVWMESAEDSRVAQVDAGRAYLRLALVVARSGLSIHPMSQALAEFPEMRPTYDRIRLATACAPGNVVQMLARIGRSPDSGHSPRRAVESFLKA